MKKRNNKIIVLVLAAIIFLVSLVIFILNYSKDDSSFTILEKKWINDNTSNIIDVSVYNDVPSYGKNGRGVIFDFLDTFTEKYKINFNKVSYLASNPTNLRDASFRILNSEVSLTDNDILFYEDNYVLVSPKDDVSIDCITDMSGLTVGVLSSDISLATDYLSDAEQISFVPEENIDKLKEEVENETIDYLLIPQNMYTDYILENNWHILYHLNDLSKKYVLTINNKTLLNIMKKYYLSYSAENKLLAYKESFLDEYFLGREIAEADRISYNASSYTVGYITYMPYESKEEQDFVGTLSNYLSGFEDLFDIDFKLISYRSIEELKLALSHGEVDLAFANFNTNNLNIDTIYTSSPFKEEYVILSKDTFVVNSAKSLRGHEVATIKNSYLNDLLTTSGAKTVTYDNTDDLLRKIDAHSLIAVDKETYNYYHNRKFSDYNVLYTGTLPYEYRFVIRDVNKNSIFADMFNYYVSSINYESIRFKYNTNSKVYDSHLLMTIIIAIAAALIITFLIIIFKKHKNKEKILNNGNKLRYIDAMTSLKNRTYLNYKIKEWDDNSIYPQAFVVVDLNNIKDINDSHGHEEGDMVIKKAASILIVNQEANTDIIRTDGNEFLIYMVGYEEKAVVAYTRKIYKELKELPYGYGAAIGYSMIMDEIKTVDDAINEATIDMRNKKES